MMPLMSAFFSYAMPLALGVYWLFGSMLQFVQQFVINLVVKKDKEKILALEKEVRFNEKVTEQIGKNTEEAIRKGLEELKVSREDVKIEVLEEASSGGVLGILSAKMAKVRLTVDKK